MDAQDELGKLRAQLALCQRLNLELTDSKMRQAVEEYASKLEAKLWLLQPHRHHRTEHPDPWTK